MSVSDKKYEQCKIELLRTMASMASENPDMIGTLRLAMKTNASSMITNIPGLVIMTAELSDEIDSFLKACELGEIDPALFLEKTESIN